MTTGPGRVTLQHQKMVVMYRQHNIVHSAKVAHLQGEEGIKKGLSRGVCFHNHTSVSQTLSFNPGNIRDYVMLCLVAAPIFSRVGYRVDDGDGEAYGGRGQG